MKKILFIFACLFAFPIVSKAAYSCDEYNKLASNVNIIYEITYAQNGTPIFVVTMTNLKDGMIVFDGKKMYNKFANETFVQNLTTSGNYNYKIYVKNCGLVGGNNITLPTYNAYYKDELCKGLEGYSICQRWSGYTANRQKFESDIKKLKEQKKQVTEEQKSEEKEEKRWFEMFAGIFVQFWWLITIIMIVFIGIYYSIRAKEKKKEFNFKV